jgi:ketosteroid isomerase-like protein
MSLSALPQPIKAFLQATASRDRAALLASYADDAVLIDMGEEHRAAMKSLAGPTASISARTSACIRFTPRSDLAGDRIGRLRMVEEKLDLPAPVLGFVRAINMYDLDGMASRFAPDAIANNQMRHYAGREAIRA